LNLVMGYIHQLHRQLPEFGIHVLHQEAAFLLLTGIRVQLRDIAGHIERLAGFGVKSQVKM